MYLIRRIYKTKPGESRKVASLVHKQATIYKEAGHRPEFRVSFNGYTLPGEPNVVFLEWIAINGCRKMDLQCWSFETVTHFSLSSTGK